VNAADFHSKYGSGVVDAAMYDDGIILYLALSDDTVEQFRHRLKDSLDSACRSEDGFCSALVLRGNTYRLMDRAAAIAEELGEALTFTDNRTRDDHEIDHFLNLIGGIQ
jgi:hypothetical protein